MYFSTKAFFASSRQDEHVVAHPLARKLAGSLEVIEVKFRGREAAVCLLFASLSLVPQKKKTNEERSIVLR